MARERLARASFKSCGPEPSRILVLPDPRSEWIRLGLDSPILGSPKKAFSNTRTTSNVPCENSASSTDAAGYRRISRHSFSPPVPSPLASQPVWVASNSDRDFTLGRGSTSNEGTDNISHAVSLLEKSPQIDDLASPFIYGSPTLFSCPSAPRIPALIPDVLSSFHNQLETSANTSSSLDIVTCDSGEDVSFGKTSSTRLTSQSSIIHTAESTEIDALMKEVAPWDHLDSERDAQALASTSSSLSSLRSSNSLPSLLPSSVSLSTARSASSAPISISSSLNTSASMPLGSVPSHSSLNLLQNFPLPPPTIIVTTPSVASLATKVKAAHDSGAFMDEWDEVSDDSGTSEDEERVVSLDLKIVEATVVALKTVFGEDKPRLGGMPVRVKGKENKPSRGWDEDGKTRGPKHDRSASTPRQPQRGSSSTSKRSSIPLSSNSTNRM